MRGSSFDEVLDQAMAEEAARVRRAFEDEVSRFQRSHAAPPRPHTREQGAPLTARSARSTAAFARLGLHAAASIEDVRRAFRRLAYATHPDRGGTMEAFVALEAAYREALAQATRAA